ncbi:MAG TPA: hypothetical protein DEF82_04130 [Crocinitomicaceae bacterium]|nr:hypothetical protein [Flavobacteriales bacterium]HBW85942.1 hypothetical protein [Crocinitomicaceae bacterium]
MAMKLFNTPSRYKRFSFYTRFYDERKERLELKKKQYEDLENATEEERKAIFREQMRDSWAMGKEREGAKLQSNIRILILIAVILILGYFVFNGLEQIESVVFRLME